MTILTRSSLPAAVRSSSFRLISSSGTAPYMRVVIQRIGLEVRDVGAGQHQPVVMRLMAVAVHQDDVARRDQRLDDDLVCRRRPVGDEERLAGAERLGWPAPGRHAAARSARAANRARRMWPTSRPGKCPVRRSPPCRESSAIRRSTSRARSASAWKTPGRPVAVFAQAREERRAVPVADARAGCSSAARASPRGRGRRGGNGGRAARRCSSTETSVIRYRSSSGRSRAGAGRASGPAPRAIAPSGPRLPPSSTNGRARRSRAGTDGRNAAGSRTPED